MQPTSTNPNPPFPVEPIAPDLLAWARQALDVPDVLEQIRQIKAGGGCTLEWFIAELERRAQ